jgi:cysteinyl-tRNA synthetase
MQLFDTATKSLVELSPPPAHIGMYICGPTVYARAHVGNARPFVLGMWLRSWLRASGNQVTFVHNITDVNDKIYAAAPGASAALADQATAWYLEDVGDLGLGMPDHVPRVTQFIPEISAFIEALVAVGFAYDAGGDVYFRVGKDEHYGSLSRQRVAEVEDHHPNPAKEDPHDFALWKATGEGEDTAWDSPWGKGRPGWHIECSVMAEALLGKEFELHGGGLDLVFPHHDNELAQSRALGHGFARIWAHNGMLRFTGSKMSKSEGNTATLREVLDEWGAEVLLVFLLTAHWRKPIDFSQESMAQAAARAQRLRNAFTLPAAPGDESRWAELAQALDDDFDTPRALAVLHRWASDGQLELLRRGLGIFGLASLADRAQAPPELVALAERRQAARAARDFGAADRLRAEIEAAGWEVRDEEGGPTLVPRRPEPASDGP